MSVVNPFGKLFNRKPAPPDADLNLSSAQSGPGSMGRDSDALLSEGYAGDGLSSVQGDPGAPAYSAASSSGAAAHELDDAGDDLITLPLLGRATAAQHQRRLLILLAAGLVVLATIAGWVLQQADRSAQQLAATGQSLMQSQRLAKSVSQALVGSPQAFPDVVESSGVLARNVRALNGGDRELGVQALGEAYRPELEAVTPLVDRAERNAQNPATH